jgi:flagellar L-ring protein precursor FlgH
MSSSAKATHCSPNHLFLRFVAGTTGVLLLLDVLTLQGQSKAIAASKNIKDPAAGSLDDYLKRVHAESASNQPAAGSVWSDSGRFARLVADVRALQPHDLISVVVSEALESSTDGTVKGSRTSVASSAITALFQKLSASSAAQNLVNMNANSALNAQGQSANNSSLSTVLGGEVVEVLPNGMLLIEAARKVEFSQQTQTVVLRGLVRPEDISQSNRVLSTAISDLTLQVRGQGIITDYTHRPNLLVRLLQRALIF